MQMKRSQKNSRDVGVSGCEPVLIRFERDRSGRQFLRRADSDLRDKVPRGRDDEERLTADVIVLASPVPPVMGPAYWMPHSAMARQANKQAGSRGADSKD